MTKEEVQDLADLLDAKVSWDGIATPGITKGMAHTAKRAAAALRQLVQERDDLKDRLHDVTEVKDALYSKLEIREIERDREDRLLRAEWNLSMVPGADMTNDLTVFCWWNQTIKETERVVSKDRAEAARLAEEKCKI